MVSDGETEIPTAGRVRRGSGQKTQGTSKIPARNSSRISTTRFCDLVDHDSSEDEVVMENVKLTKAKRTYDGGTSRRIKEPGIVIRERFFDPRLHRDVTGRLGGKKKRRLLEIVDPESDDEYLYNSDSCSDETVDDHIGRADRARKRINRRPKLEKVGTIRYRRGGKNDISSGEDDITLEPSERDSVLDSNQGKPYYRCNLNGVLKDICSLNLHEVHLDAIRRTPFWHFVEAALNMTLAEQESYKKCDFTIAAIVRLFVNSPSEDIQGFKLGERYVCPLKEDIEFTFGIRDGDVPITKGPIGTYGFVRRCWPARGDVHFDVIKTNILPVLREKIALGDDNDHAVEDVARLVHLYLLATLFMPNNNYRVGWSVLKFVDKFEKICEYDWCGLILKALLKDLMKGSTDIQNCSVFLLFWFCEVCPFLTPRNDVVDFPRFRKWSLVAMKDAFSELNMPTLDTDFVLRKDFLVKKREMKMLSAKYALTVEQRTTPPVEGNQGGGTSTPMNVDEGKSCGVSANNQSSGIINSNSHVTNKAENKVLSWEEQLNKTCKLPITSTYDPSLLVHNNIDCTVGIGSNQLHGNIEQRADYIQADSTRVASESDHMGKDFSWRQYLNSDGGCEFDGITVGLKDTSTSGHPPAEKDKCSIFVEDWRDKRIRDIEHECAQVREKGSLLEQEVEELKKINAELTSEALKSTNSTEALIEQHCKVVERLTEDLGMMEKRYTESEHVRAATNATTQMAIDARVRVEKELADLKEKFKQVSREKNTLETENAVMAIHEADQTDKVTLLEQEIVKKDAEILELRNTLGPIEQRSTEKAAIVTATTGMVALVDYPTTPADSGQPHLVVSRIPRDKTLTPLKPANLFAVPQTQGPAPSPHSAMKPPLSRVVKKEKAASESLNYDSPVNLKNSFTPDNLVEGLSWKTPEQNLGLMTPSEAVINSDSPINEAVKLARKSEKSVHDSIIKEGTSVQTAISVEGVVLKTVIRKMRVNKKADACKVIPVHVLNWFAKKFMSIDESSTILTINTSSLSASLRLKDIELIINHERFNDSIIDSWALLLVTDVCGGKKLKETRTSVSRKPFIFTSCVWQYVARFNVLETYSQAAISFIDNKIPAAVKHDNWIIPINTSGDKCPVKFDGDHWTLLHYSVSQNRWTFFNSLAPRLDQDFHYQRATLLMDYIETSIKAYAEATGLIFPICQARSTTARDCSMPQQSRNSLDCGPIVCYMIEILLHEKECEQRNWTHAAAGEYRSHMVEYFQNSIIRTGSC